MFSDQLEEFKVIDCEQISSDLLIASLCVDLQVKLYTASRISQQFSVPIVGHSDDLVWKPQSYTFSDTNIIILNELSLKTIYRVSQKYGTLHATFEMKVVGQPNLGIVSTKILPNLLEYDKGPRALWMVPNSWGPGFFLWKHVPCNISLNLSKQDKHVETLNRVLVGRLQNGGIFNVFYFSCECETCEHQSLQKSVLVSDNLLIRKFT